jgi:hypothetical protein
LLGICCALIWVLGRHGHGWLHAVTVSVEPA